jgi:tRNA-specific 2-thiouridylase
VPAACRVSALSDDSLQVQFDEPQWAVAPGQFAVLYDGEECLGGAVIERAIISNQIPEKSHGWCR